MKAVDASRTRPAEREPMNQTDVGAVESNPASAALVNFCGKMSGIDA